MSKRTLASRIFMPDELNTLYRAFQRACTECDLTGAPGGAFLARSLMTRYRHGVTNEEDLVKIARLIVWRRRGLSGLHVAPQSGKRPTSLTTH